VCGFISRSSILFHWSSYIFCASTMLILLLWLCSIVWNQVLWHLQHCSFCSILPWLFMVFCVSKWTLGLIFKSLWKLSLWFWWELHWTCRLFLIVKPLLLCWFCQSMSMGDISTFCNLWFLSSMVCSFSCRCHLHHLLRLVLGIWLFWSYCKWNCFPIFFLNLFIIGV
jgi:hypothetical protein